MTNFSTALVYTPFLIFTAMVIKACLPKRNKAIIKSFICTCLMVFFWQLTSILSFLMNEAYWSQLMHAMRMPFIALTTLALLLFVFYFYHMDQYISKGLFLILSVIPAITTLFCLTYNHQRLLYRHIAMATTQPLLLYTKTYGVWFYIHSAYCYILIGIMAFIILRRHFKLPRAFRLCSSFLMLSLIVSVLTNLCTMFFLRGTPFDLNIIGTSISLVIMYIAMINNDRLDFLMFARQEIFHYLDIAIFILGSSQEIIENNRVAAQWAKEWGIQIQDVTFDQVLDQLACIGASFKQSIEDTDGKDIYLLTPTINKIYHLEEEVIDDKSGRQLGKFITLADVTQNRKLIHWLDQTAAIDALTGLSNRRRFELDKETYNQPASLPLVVIQGDVNGLKTVNDNMGHHYGDQLLQSVAQILEECVPHNGKVYRMGGDEYLLILTSSSVEQAEELINAIENRSKQYPHLPFPISISLGFAIRDTANETIEDTMHRADEQMYIRKKEYHRLALAANGNT